MKKAFPGLCSCAPVLPKGVPAGKQTTAAFYHFKRTDCHLLKKKRSETNVRTPLFYKNIALKSCFVNILYYCIPKAKHTNYDSDPAETQGVFV